MRLTSNGYRYGGRSGPRRATAEGWFSSLLIKRARIYQFALAFSGGIPIELDRRLAYRCHRIVISGSGIRLPAVPGGAYSTTGDFRIHFFWF